MKSQWDPPGFVLVSYHGCSLNHGQFTGEVDGAYCSEFEDGFSTCTACSVKFPCPAGLTTVPKGKFAMLPNR
jgi:hypothetical protein